MTYMDAYGNQAGSSMPVRVPPQGGSGITKIESTCVHDFLFLRTEETKAHQSSTDGKLGPHVTYIGYVDDVFYCRRCLEYRKVTR